MLRAHLRSVRLTTILALVCGTVSVVAQDRILWTDASMSFVYENGNLRQFSSDHGTVQLRGGTGWLRVPKVFSDFRLTLEFRNLEAKTDAGLVVRSWTGRGGWPDQGFRFRLSGSRSEGTVRLLEGRRQKVTTAVPAAAPAWGEVGEWQRLEVVAEAQRLTVTLNGQPAGVFEIEERAGHVLLDTRTGIAEFRGVALYPSVRRDERPPAAMSCDELKAAGGTLPVRITMVRPRYSYEAMARKVIGDVTLEAVVLPDGSLAAIRVTGPLDPDLDQSAIGALQRWRFKPAILNGQAVPVLVTVTVSFTLE